MSKSQRAGAVLDLEEYRRRREREGTWPPTRREMDEFWNEQAERARSLRSKRGKSMAELDAELQRLVDSLNKKKQIKRDDPLSDPGSDDSD